MGKYKILLFDADYTLLDFDTDMALAFEKTYISMGLDRHIPYSHEMLESYNKFNMNWWEKFERGECSKKELFIGRFIDFFKHHGFEENPENINSLYFENLAKHGTSYPGALDMLNLLKKTYSIYIVTNANADSQKTRLTLSGLSDYFIKYYVSETVGAAKPDLRYFEYVLSDIGEPDKSKYLIIGDSLTTDINGANNIGIDSIWYTTHNLSADTTSPKYKPTYTVQSYDEILEILK